VYLLVRQGDREVVLCLAHKDGKELWRADHPTPYKVDPAARAHGKGPKATPALGGGRLYTFSISGILSCFDAEKGALVWRQEFTRDFPGTSPLYGAAASPLLDGGLCIVPVGGHDRGALAAFDAGTGEKKWSWTGDGPGYSSPIAAELGGKRQAIVLLQNRVVGVAAASGALLWSLPFKTPYDQNIVTPVLHGETVIYSGLEQGTTAVRLVPRGSSLVPEEAWSNPDVFFYMSSPVVEGNRLFGMTSRRRGIFYALDAGSGKVIWESPPGLGENVAVLSAGGLVWLLTTGAELILLEANASSYAPLRKYKVSGGPTWAHPAILPDRVLIKDDKSLASWTWKM
jgi:outer membrane protein assembly factor BamB